VATKAPRQELICPHCHKRFTAEELGSGAQRGFKCPHCKLFVPEGRGAEVEPGADEPA
jgi:tRNA(Ile2) C34 agmatinyltransferase TiaS